MIARATSRLSKWFRMAVIASAILVPSFAAGETHPRMPLEIAPPAPHHIRFIYAIPADGVDRRLDLDGTLHRSIEAIQGWLAEQSGGMRLRVRQYLGAPEVLFVRLELKDSEGAGENVFARRLIEAELAKRGLLRKDEIYSILYDGLKLGHCGQSAFPPSVQGQLSIQYLRGISSTGINCATPIIHGDRTGVLHFDFGVLHEIFHSLGAVPACAPNSKSGGGHVSDSPTDLMYTGPLPWRPSQLDVGRDDYFGHGRPDCLDVARSPFLERVLK